MFRVILLSFILKKKVDSNPFSKFLFLKITFLLIISRLLNFFVYSVNILLIYSLILRLIFTFIVNKTSFTIFEAAPIRAPTHSGVLNIFVFFLIFLIFRSFFLFLFLCLCVFIPKEPWDKKITKKIFKKHK